jgi:GPH family glycoside/pentoside/hexuronide:cation symporter
MWGLAALGTTLISGIYGALLPIFYQDYLGLTARWISLASIIYAVWNAINDPLFGYITDSTRSKRGRCIPYMRFTAPFLALTFILLWFAPPNASQQTLFFWMLGSMLLYDTCYTIIGLVYSSLLPEITESDDERNGLQISYSLFGMLGLILGFMIPDFFRPKTGTSLSFLPLQAAMIIVALVSATLIIATTFWVKERPEYTRVDKPVPLGAALRLTLTSKSFLVLVAENFMSTLMYAMVLSMVFYLADYVLKVNTMVILVCVFVPLIIGIPVTSLLQKRLGVVGAQQLLLAIAGTGLILIAFVPNPLIYVCLMAAGFGLAGPQTLTNILFAQVADEDELRSGVRREGMFFGINALITKPSQSVALALVPLVLEATHFVTRESGGGAVFLQQSAEAIFGIKALIGLIPGTALIIGAVLLHWFPLRGAYLEKVRADILILHAKKQSLLK